MAEVVGGAEPLFVVEVDGELIWRFYGDRVEFIDLFEGVFETVF